MKIFITGCAKSGTTLFKRLFYAFNDITVIDDEAGIYDFDNCTPDTEHILGKRRWDTLFSTSRLTKPELDKQIDILGDLFVINVVRHPYAVLASYRKDWDIDGGADWVESINHYNKYKHLIDMNIRYEDLLINPDAIQLEIIKRTGLNPNAKFSSYPKFYPWNHLIGFEENYKPRKIDTSKVIPPLKQDTMVKDELIDKYIKQFGYDK